MSYDYEFDELKQLIIMDLDSWYNRNQREKILWLEEENKKLREENEELKGIREKKQ